ncbi:MAG: ATP-dependent DNA ligase, partial [Actinomycetota bacterium]|nr:ATP-dependent DNA ligase [Actinomycetota bacterium]
QRRAPDLVTTAWWKRDRTGAVFVDWNQNTRDHTIRSAYSVRGVPEAVVSTPLHWDEVPDAEPGDFTLATVPQRFAHLGDVHAGIDDAVFSLEPLLEWAGREEHQA